MKLEKGPEKGGWVAHPRIARLDSHLRLLGSHINIVIFPQPLKYLEKLVRACY